MKIESRAARPEDRPARGGPGALQLLLQVPLPLGDLGHDFVRAGCGADEDGVDSQGRGHWSP